MAGVAAPAEEWAPEWWPQRVEVVGHQAEPQPLLAHDLRYAAVRVPLA